MIQRNKELNGKRCQCGANDQDSDGGWIPKLLLFEKPIGVGKFPRILPTKRIAGDQKLDWETIELVHNTYDVFTG